MQSTTAEATLAIDYKKHNLIRLILAYVPVLRFFSMKAAELKCQNLIVKKVCQVEHFKTFRKAIGSELGL